MGCVLPETQAEERYACAVGELWSGLARTLRRLEGLAASPERLAELAGLDELRRLQYRLHAASQEVLGLSPPAAAASAHDELASALADARDATGELAEDVELDGLAAAEARIYEWRGALFRVRLARLRLDGSRPVPAPEPEQLPGLAAPISALVLSLGGTSAFLLGATIGPWPLWACGALALCASLLVYRP
jgi:hypothetical protein